MKRLLLGFSVALILLFGCTPRENSYLKAFNPNNSGKWQINYAKPVENNSNIFKWTIYVGIGIKNPDYTHWTTKTTWKELSPEETMNQLGSMWQLVPPRNFYFYKLTTPGMEWDYLPTTMVSARTSANDQNVLVEDTLFGRTNDPILFLANQPVQLTSVVTDPKNQTITFTWEPLNR